MSDAITNDVKRNLNAIALWALLVREKNPGITASKDDNNMYIIFASDLEIRPDIEESLDTLPYSSAKKNSDGSWEITVPITTTRGGCDESAKNMG